MKINSLACRLYRIEPKLEREIKRLLLNSKIKIPILYDTVKITDGKNIDLYIELRERHKNEYGHEVIFWADQTTELQDREHKKQIIRYYLEYKIQVFENTKEFSEYVLIFGPKHVDGKLKKAIMNYLKKDGEKIPDPLILIKVDFNAVEKLTKEFPNLQHFCIRDIPDERTKGIIVRGNMLEETDLFDRYVKEEETKGPINFLGVTIDYGKLVYVGKDGSIYSKMSFAKEDAVKIIYDLFVRFKKIHALSKRIEDF